MTSTAVWPTASSRRQRDSDRGSTDFSSTHAQRHTHCVVRTRRGTRASCHRYSGRPARPVTSTGSNTTIGAVASNVPFNKAEMTKIARVAHGRFARSINPVHTMSDGDAIFTLFTGKASSVRADVFAISAIAATVMAQAVPVRLFKPRA